MAAQTSKTLVVDPSLIILATPVEVKLPAFIENMQAQYIALYKLYRRAYIYIFANADGLTIQQAFTALGTQAADFDNFILGVLEFFLTYQSTVLVWNPAGSTIIHQTDGTVSYLASGGTSSGTPQ